MREIVNSLELYFYFDESDACMQSTLDDHYLPAGVYFLFSTNGVAAKPGVLHKKIKFDRTPFFISTDQMSMYKINQAKYSP